MTQPPNITVCGGANVSVPFTGGAANATYNWTNDNPDIGLAASGSGSLNFTATTSTTQQMATISVKPKVGACSGLPYVFTITVNPHLILDDPPDQTVCALQNVQATFSGPANPTVSWTNSNPNVGLPASGNGNLNFTAANVSSVQNALITVTPTGGMCGATPQNFNLTVIPTPVMNPVANVIGCSDQPIIVDFAGNSGTDFSWTNDNPNIGLASFGTGPLNFIGTTNGGIEVAHIAVTPVNDPCEGSPKTFTIRIYPSFTATAGDGCDTLPTQLQVTANTNPATYFWTGPGGFTSVLKNPTIDLAGNYIVVVTNSISGCTARDTASVTNCCTTKAGSFDTARIVLCNYKPFIGHFKNNEILETDDGLQFILFKDTLNILGSILARSDSAYFLFDADTMQIDSLYYIAAIAGDTITNDSIEITDPCLSISKRIAVVWKLAPTIERVPTVDVVCKEDCINLSFEFTGTPPFSYRIRIEQNGQFIYDKTIESIGFQQTISICPLNFITPMTGGELHFLIGNLADFYCNCGE